MIAAILVPVGDYVARFECLLPKCIKLLKFC